MSTAHPVDVVVGAASGMGRASAFELRDSPRLLLVDRDEAAVTALAAELGAQAAVCDLADAASIDALAGRIDRLGSMIVTAGVSGPPGDVTLTINLLGYARLLRALDDAIGDGTAVALFSSMVEAFPQPPEVLAELDDPLAADLIGRLTAAGADPTDPGQGYVLSKWGVIRLMRRNTYPWRQRGARIVCVTPGVIDTPLLGLTRDLPMVQEMRRVAGRFGRAEEVAQVAAFLVSDKASYVTGVNVNVDGGYVTSLLENPDLQAEAARIAEEFSAQTSANPA